MTFYQKLQITSALAALVALLVLGRAPPRGGRDSTTIWLAILTGALILVGIVSDTMIRHLIQIAPLVVAILLSLSRSGAASAAAAPLFAFWLLLMGAVWLFLLGVARIVTGTVPPIEIALTVVIGAASAVGLALTHRQGTALTFAGRLGTVIVFALLQYAAMWLSTRPFAATR